MQLELALQQPYNLEANVRAHGWISLAPCRWLAEEKGFQRVERLKNGRVVLLRITDQGDRLAIDVQADSPLAAAEQAEIVANVRWMLKLDEDLSSFYQLAAGHPHLAGRLPAGGGRLLRSPTLFEDVVKTICTTNTTWSQTIAMVDRLVSCLGDPFPGNPALHAFPTPEQVAAADNRLFQDVIRMGYRNDYVRQLAAEIVDGRRDLEALKTAELSAEALKKAFKTIRGVGDYAAHTLLMLLGHYHELAIDSAVRSFVSQKYFQGEAVTDQEIAAIYEPWGRWKYLAYWFEGLD